MILTSNGKPLSLGNRLMEVGNGSGGNVAVVPVVPGLPTDSMTGWWDIASRAPGDSWVLPGSGSTTKALSLSVSAGTPRIVPHIAGLLPGFFVQGQAASFSLRTPVVYDSSINANTMAVGANQEISIYMVWSRPNHRQPGNPLLDTNPISVLEIDGTPVLRLDQSGVDGDQFTLFPTTAALKAGSVSLRHTHGLVITMSAGKISVWLDDGTQLFNNVTSPVSLGATTNLEFLKNSQLIFHEAAVWSKALASADRASLLSYSQRWPMGKRWAANMMTIGQSNFGLFAGSYTLIPRLSTGIQYLTGCLTATPFWGGGQYNGVTAHAGQGLYELGSNERFLDCTGGGDPSTWPLGFNGNEYMTFIDNMNADDKANVFGMFWFWSETDCEHLTYAKKAEYTAAMKRAIGFIRARLGKTAATMPFMVINSMPYITDEGNQTHREVMQDLINDTANNVHFMMPMTNDATGQSDGWDSATGQETGPGDGGHRDLAGMLAYQRRSIVPISRAILAAQAAAGVSDAVTALDAALPVVGGPKIVSAHYEGGTSILVTVQHDGGSDLIVPLKAVQGVGWSLMDGLSDSVAGNPGNPGVMIDAVACSKVSATQLRITLASAPVHPIKAQLYYPYGQGYGKTQNYATIGRGNAVTDNFSSVVLPVGWRIGSDLGAAEQIDYPLQATTYGVQLS